MASSLPFDPFTQPFTLLLQDGTPFSLSLVDLDDFILYSVEICINYAAQLGASCILLIALLLLTKADKRNSPVFILNAFSLVLNVIRNVLQCLYFTGPFSQTYAYFGQDYSRVPKSAYATSIAATVLAVLLLVCIEASLILQVRVVCAILKPLYRQAIFASSAIIALLAIGFRLALCVENSRFIISLEPPTALNWLESASNITTSISICWFCAVFVTKLGFALHERRRLGLKRFGPMQIIFIMGCQTLIIPGISYLPLSLII
jgi:pheromone alpha factor receptor